VAFSAVALRVRLGVSLGVVVSIAAFLTDGGALPRVLRALGVASSSAGGSDRFSRDDRRGVGPGERAISDGVRSENSEA
jgi:hypothetical protein